MPSFWSGKGHGDPAHLFELVAGPSSYMFSFVSFPAFRRANLQRKITSKDPPRQNMLIYSRDDQAEEDLGKTRGKSDEIYFCAGYLYFL